MREAADLRNSNQKGQRLGPLTMTGQSGVSPADRGVSRTGDNLMCQIIAGFDQGEGFPPTISLVFIERACLYNCLTQCFCTSSTIVMLHT